MGVTQGVRARNSRATRDRPVARACRQLQGGEIRNLCKKQKSPSNPNARQLVPVTIPNNILIINKLDNPGVDVPMPMLENGNHCSRLRQGSHRMFGQDCRIRCVVVACEGRCRIPPYVVGIPSLRAAGGHQLNLHSPCSQHRDLVGWRNHPPPSKILDTLQYKLLLSLSPT